MRLVSIGVLFDDEFGSENVLDVIQYFFYQSVVNNYRKNKLNNSTVNLFFWEKLVVDENFDTHNLKRDIESKIPNSKVFINELISNQSRIEKYLTLIISSIIAVTGLVVGVIL